ncbi:MAG: aldehyde dehydrogenase family protein [Candidatus Micrarchaeia archaeon]
MEEYKINLGEYFLEMLENTETMSFKNFIGGVWRRGKAGKKIDIYSPINGSRIADVSAATEEDVEDAIKAAYEARTSISSMPGFRRAKMLNEAGNELEKHKEEFVQMLMLEAAKTKDLAAGEVTTAINRLGMMMQDLKMLEETYLRGDWSSDKQGKNAIIRKEPVGTVLCISSFNYPLFSMVSKVAPALLAGNSVVGKPATDDPITALMFARVLEKVGFPAGTINMITGRGSDIGDLLIKNKKISMVTATGSTSTGLHIAEIAGIKKLHLELGGKGTAIVDSDADIELAASKILEGALRYSGQRCDAISRVIVIKDVHKVLVEKLLEGIDAYKLGNPFDAGVRIVPLINEKAAIKAEELVKDAIENKATLLKGGTRHKNSFEATLLDNVPLNARIAWEETFGPVVVVMEAKSLDEAIRLVKGSDYALDSCIFTRNVEKAIEVAKELDEGTVTINDMPSHGTGYFPFGGNKNSGLGREGIGYSAEEMTRIKVIQGEI